MPSARTQFIATATVTAVRATTVSFTKAVNYRTRTNLAIIVFGSNWELILGSSSRKDPHYSTLNSYSLVQAAKKCRINHPFMTSATITDSIAVQVARFNFQRTIQLTAIWVSNSVHYC